jgi:hypothetical protein
MAEGVDGGTYARSSSRRLHQHAPVFSSDTADVSSGNADEYRTVMWGYPVRTRSDACVAFIDAFFRQVCTVNPSPFTRHVCVSRREHNARSATFVYVELNRFSFHGTRYFTPSRAWQSTSILDRNSEKVEIIRIIGRMLVGLVQEQFFSRSFLLGFSTGLERDLTSLSWN